MYSAAIIGAAGKAVFRIDGVVDVVDVVDVLSEKEAACAITCEVVPVSSL